ncbi:MAG: ubiquinol-cytochrome C chaperone family protein [Beijerinckiaceae bacterium]
MIVNLLRRRGNRRLIDDLHGRIVAAARRPALFRPPYDVPDSLEGRFDLLILFAILVMRRLESLPEPGPEIAQGLADRLFEDFDPALREMGVGDLVVPKRMKKLAEAFAGRSVAYRDAITRDDAALAAAIARNIYASEAATAPARALTRYVSAAIMQLDQADLGRIIAPSSLFPDPETRDARLT